jgi:hypothetical protein
MKLCDEKFVRVMTSGEVIRAECPFDDDWVEKFDELDDICHEHIFALQSRLRILHSFRNLWVNTARIPQAGDSSLTQSGNREINLRLLVFKKLDDAMLGVQCTALRALLAVFWKLKHVWSRFQVPDLVDKAFVARCQFIEREGMSIQCHCLLYFDIVQLRSTNEIVDINRDHCKELRE